MPENPFMEAFLQGIRETEAGKRQKAGFAHEDDPNSAANQQWRALHAFDQQLKDAELKRQQAIGGAQYGIQPDQAGVDPTVTPDKDSPFNFVQKLFGVSGQQPYSAPAEGNVGVPGVGPLGRTQPEPQLQQRATTGFDVGQTTLPSPGGPPVQPDSNSDLANFFRQAQGMQGAVQQPPADTLNQTTPGMRMPGDTAGAANEMVGQGPGQGGGGGAILPDEQQQIVNIGGYKVPLPQAPFTSINVPEGSSLESVFGKGKVRVRNNMLPNVMQILRDEAKTDPSEDKTWPVPDDVADSLQIPRGSKIKPADYIKLLSDKKAGAATKENIDNWISELYEPGTKPERKAALRRMIALHKEKDQGVTINLGNINDPNSLMSKYTATTGAGNRYIDASNLKGKELAHMDEQGRAQGMPVFGGKEVEAVRNLDTARDLLGAMSSQILGKLPKDASGRITVGLDNKVKQYVQSDNILGAYDSWNDGAIRIMRGISGVSGRMNILDIQIALKNNRIQPTDTVGVAMQKVANLQKMLDGSEKSLFHGRAKGVDSIPGASRSLVVRPDGTVRDLKTEENADAYRKKMHELIGSQP